MRSQFEARIAAELRLKKVEFGYEDTKFHYTVPKSYRPDFRIGNIYIEAKGYHRNMASYLSSIAHFKAQNPDLDFRFLFDHGISGKLLGKKLTMGGWCTRNRIPWAEGSIPDEWIKEGLAGVKK